jgi:hypothetical protein
MVCAPAKQAGCQPAGCWIIVPAEAAAAAAAVAAMSEAEHLTQIEHGHTGQLVVAVSQVDLLVGGCRIIVPERQQRQ